MPSFVYDNAKEQIMLGAIDFNTDDIRVLLVDVDANTDTDTLKSAATFAGFTTLGEVNGTNYTSPGIAFTTQTVEEDGANNRAEFKPNNVTWSAINVGDVGAAIIYKFVIDLNSSIPIARIDTGGFPVTTNGGDLTIQWNAEGALQFT